MSSQNTLAGGRKEEKGKNIQVVVRCRPFNAVERKSASYGVLDCDQNRKEVAVKTGGVTDKQARKTYTFDMVFGPSAKQIEVYRSVLCPILDEVMMGYNCTVFAYGQTGTGKTFTMEGERSTDEEYTWEEDPLAGIIPRTLHQIFDKLSDNNTEFSVKVSLLEIYNEELFDLLSPCPDVTERLQMFDDPRNKRGVVIKGLEEITVHTKDEVYQILERGAAKRKTASTLMNAYSSRSHSVFSVTIHMKEVNMEGEELVKIGKLNLVDLAGSENIGRSGAVDKRAREAGNINQSLLTLGRVITALVERRPHIPYRESKLTRILQDSLGGRTKTSIIATVSPASVNLEETMSTLDYANRAKSILNKPEVNQKLTKRTLIKEYTEEIERLKRDLAATRDKHGVYLSSENYESMNSKLLSHELQITEYMDKMTVLEDELKKVMEMFSDSKEQADQLTSLLEETNQQLQAAHRDLQETRLRLGEETFITSKLMTTEGELYSTADKLLSTADVSTKDVSGLHAKLDRKREVDRHNSRVQQNFAQHMENSYSQMQRSLQQQSNAHQSFMEYFGTTVSDLHKVNGRALEDAVSTVRSYKAGVKAVLEENVGHCVTTLEQQESLSVESKQNLLHMLEEHQMHLEEALMAQALPTVTTLMSMMGNLTETMECQRAMIQRMETMKREMTSHLDKQAQALSEMRGAALEGFSSLKAEIGDLKEKLGEADQTHKTNLSQLLQCLQGQLSLLSENTQSSFQGLMSRTEALSAPVDSLQQALHTRCSEAETQERSRLHSFEAAVDGLVSETSRVTDELAATLEESAGYRSNLQTSLKALGEVASNWCHKATERVETAAQAQVDLTQANKDSLLSLAQPVETRGEALLQETADCFRRHQTEASGILNNLQDQTGKDMATVQSSREELSTRAAQALQTLHSFLREELREDIPTGSTPQRKEYDFPRVLVRSRARDELIEEFHAQMEELQDEYDSQDEPEEEIKTVDQGSTEEELAASDVSAITEPSFVDMNIMCDENSRGPFFKQKRNGKNKKENRRAPSSTPKKPEGDVANLPRSKLPLRCQN
ncbi:kinesin-like protein KIF11 [Alosa sapidissima]|uniref:kinesin-like protein KIF11 n=1 Tax=Alosa sapidissima TaxID=34773 RepID=UPI001C08B09B|nr:kinesin-like protein KIF11 [Alosa sapidissima]XP_041922136.1 kinesin-like protein KIF11 [Alosa sapidissima]